MKAVVGGKRFKPSSGPVWKTRMLCVGNEDSLLGCQNDDNIAYEGHCSQASQAGVICSKRKNLCDSYDVTDISACLIPKEAVNVAFNKFFVSDSDFGHSWYTEAGFHLNADEDEDWITSYNDNIASNTIVESGWIGDNIVQAYKSTSTFGDRCGSNTDCKEMHGLYNIDNRDEVRLNYSMVSLTHTSVCKIKNDCVNLW